MRPSIDLQLCAPKEFDAPKWLHRDDRLNTDGSINILIQRERPKA
jgi:hypothetical protein